MKWADRLVIASIVALMVSAPFVAQAKPITSTVNWTHDCLTVDGDDLDPDGDGICELLTGWRVYSAEGEFIGGAVEDGARTLDLNYNAPVWANQCFVMTAVMDDLFNPGAVLESVFSNAGGCVEVRPGNPKAPNVTN